MGLIPLPMLPKVVCDRMTPEERADYRRYLNNMAGFARFPFGRKIPMEPKPRPVLQEKGD